jgi:hypothetical protein
LELKENKNLNKESGKKKREIRRRRPKHKRQK